MARTHADAGTATADDPSPARGAPGKRTLTSNLVARASGSSGEPLRSDVQAKFESSLGADLSAVRVHTGAESADAARGAGAQAFAIGNDVHFGAGRYQPDDPFGMHLLAHEVAHTQQQAAGAPHAQYMLEVTAPGDATEREADRAAEAMVHGRPAAVTASAPAIARTPDESIYDEDEPAPASTRDAATIDAVRWAQLRSDLETERDDSRNILFVNSDAIDVIDERLKTATGDDKDQLLAKKKELATVRDAASKKLDQAVADLVICNGRADLDRPQRNDMLARRGVTVTAPATSTDTSRTTVDDKGITFASSSNANWRDGDGGSRTSNSSTSTNVGLTGASRTTSASDTQVLGDTTKTSGASSTTAVDWGKGSISSSNTSSNSSRGPTGATGSSTTSGWTASADGISANRSDTTEKDGNKNTTAVSAGAIRGNGQAGLTATVTNTKENADKSGSSRSGTVSGGVVDAKDGVGVFAGAEGSASKKTASGLECKGSVKAQGRAVVNVTEVKGSDPVKYLCTLTVTLGASVSVSGGFDKTSEASGVGGTGSLGASAGGQVVASFSTTLDEEAARAWKASLDAASAGHDGGTPETKLIAMGINQDWNAARDYFQHANGGKAVGDLKDGQSMATDETGKAGVNGSLGVKGDGATFSIGGGYEVHGEIKFAANRVGDKTIVSLLIIDGATVSGSGSAGFGMASMSVSGSHDSSSGKGYTFTIFDSTPGASGLRAELQGIRTKSALQTFANAHGDLIGVRTTTEGTTDKLGVGAKLGPAAIDFGTSHGTDHTGSETLDKDGNVIATDDVYNGDTSVGGKASLGPLSLGSNTDEHVTANVHRKLGDDGKWKETADADVSKSESSSSPDMAKSLQALDETLHKDPAALVTGKDPLLQNSEKVAVAGVFLNDHDFNNIIALADDKHRWVNCGIKDPDGWRRFGNEVRASGGDKRKVAEAMSRYFGDGENTYHQESLDELLGTQHGGGGDRYELPDGLGDQKASYAALVVNNPMGEIEEIVATGDLAKAAQAADLLAGKCEKMAGKLANRQDQFENVDIHSEMYGRAQRRAIELRKRQRELMIEASGGKADPDQLDKAAAQDEWNMLYERCKMDAAEERKVFQIIGDNYDGLFGNHDEPENVKYVNQLREVAKRWRADYARMVTLGELYGFSDAANNWRNLTPDEVRLDLAYHGHNPMSDEAKDKQAQADQASLVTSDQGEQAGKTLMMTGGMTHIGGGTWYREKSDDEMAGQDAAMHDQIQAEWGTYEAKIAQYRNKCTQAMGKCNSMSGNQGAINQPAKISWSQGFAKNGEAGQLWQEAQAVARSKGKEVRRFRALWSSAWIAWDDAAEAFKKGDELQG